MAVDAAKIADIVASAQHDILRVTPFDVDDAVTPDAAMALTASADSYVNGNEAVLYFTALRAASAALVAGTPITIGTLVAGVRPQTKSSGPGYCVTDTGAHVPGWVTVTSAGVIAFIPFDAATAGTGFVFHVEALVVGTVGATTVGE